MLDERQRLDWAFEADRVSDRFADRECAGEGGCSKDAQPLGPSAKKRQARTGDLRMVR